MKFLFRRSITILMLSVMIVGCSKPGGGYKPRAKLYKASGKVTFIGSPLIGAVVSFSPKGDQPAAVGRTNDAGEFVLTTYAAGDGAAAGDYAVVVMLFDAGESASTPSVAHFADGKVPDTHAARKSTKATGLVLPPKYADPKQTPLKATVDPNTANSFTLEVK